MRACSARGPARGEIVALTGHLARNELRGGLTFIERALRAEKAREFYEQEAARRCRRANCRAAADCRRLSGAAVTHQPHERCGALSAAGDPTLLYGGLGRHQVDRLAVRKA